MPASFYGGFRRIENQGVYFGKCDALIICRNDRFQFKSNAAIRHYGQTLIIALYFFALNIIGHQSLSVSDV